ncbi:nuclear factor NF-kappa-B p110 subunit [Apis florea]|uniref:nuclear factor NF-kappa-B p110 subunit n=1 Tax=Apis florea TaxID=7463 RepID=UPI000629BAF3|nr:nuclear factor NF-kappa-B p110 subunit [Apis florea]
MNNQDIYNPLYGSQGTASVNSPMSALLSPLSNSEFLPLKDAIIIETPYITILEQPVDKFRFRYKSEMVGTHGSLVGSSNNNNRRKNAPTVQLHKYPNNAIIRCTLVTSDEHQRIPHPHKLVHRDDSLDCDDPHDVKVSSENEYIATFHGMAIIHTAKKYIRDELIRKIKRNTLEMKKRENINATLSTIEEAHIKSDADRYQKYVNLNSVALCFQAFILDQNEIMIPITDPIYSHPINNLSK